MSKRLLVISMLLIGLFGCSSIPTPSAVEETSRAPAAQEDLYSFNGTPDVRQRCTIGFTQLEIVEVSLGEYQVSTNLTGKFKFSLKPDERAAFQETQTLSVMATMVLGDGLAGISISNDRVTFRHKNNLDQVMQCTMQK